MAPGFHPLTPLPHPTFSSVTHDNSHVPPMTPAGPSLCSPNYPNCPAGLLLLEGTEVSLGPLMGMPPGPFRLAKLFHALN